MKNKFRAWHKPTQLMDDVVLIDFYNEKIGILYADPFVQGESIQKYNFNEMELMQSTGLHDKNGVEIFEGDILKDKRGEIRFVYKVSGGFAINMFDSPRKIKDCFYESLADMQTQSWMQMSCEVIGNIYENKDLLGVKK